MSDPAASLVDHVALFGGALRERGVGVSLSDEADGLAALTLIDLGDRDEVRAALRSALKVRQRDAAAFDEVFLRLWGARGSGSRSPRPAERLSSSDPTRPVRPPDPALLAQPRSPRPADPARRANGGDPRLAAGPPPAGEAAAEAPLPALPVREEPGYSPEAALRRKPFDECSAADLAAMEALMARFALRLATRRSRRRVPAVGRGEADLRRSFRRALAHGGELLSLARRRRAIERPQLVVLCDTSGSMDPHSRFLLAFVLALREAARRSEIFAFNTTLVRLTPLLRRANAANPQLVEQTLRRLATHVADWSGGTRIGECLAEFVDRHAAAMVDHRSVVVILSDGLDRGDVSPLAGAMRALHQRARRVLWLNPLAGDPRYEPTARAMAAALPYVDHLLPAHNLESLERLLPLLAA